MFYSQHMSQSYWYCLFAYQFFLFLLISLFIYLCFFFFQGEGGGGEEGEKIEEEGIEGEEKTALNHIAMR